MIRVNKIVSFQWDEGNKFKNIKKHSVDNKEVEQAFFNFVLLSFDFKHSGDEVRFAMLGQTNEGKTLFVVFVTREKFIRVISARLASSKERKIYEKSKKS